jgi:YD repeat-containing protein
MSGATVPASLKRISLNVRVAGHTFSQSFAAETNLRTAFTWDGTDGFGRTLQGKQRINVSVGFVYDAVYLAPENFRRTFAQYPASTTAIGDRARQEITFLKQWRGSVGGWDTLASGIAGWDVDVHKAYDPFDRTLYAGTGESFGAQAANLGASTVAGVGTFGFSGDGGQATASELAAPQMLAVAANGSFYIADTQNDRVRRVGLDGVITTIAGNGGVSPDVGEIREQTQPLARQTERQWRAIEAPGDGGPATQAAITYPTGIAIGRDGSIYIAETGAHRIRKVSPGGTLSTVAGDGTAGFSGDDGPASAAQLNSPRGLAIGRDGSLYIADTGNGRVRRISPDGRIHTIAGNGDTGGGYADILEPLPAGSRFAVRGTRAASSPADGDGGPARQAALSHPVAVAIGADGSVFVSDSIGQRIRRISPSGIISTFAGGGTSGERGDGGLATNAYLNGPAQIALAPDGSLYIADEFDGVVRKVGVDGRITTVAGATTGGSSDDNQPATATQLALPAGVAVDRDGTLYVADQLNQRVRRIAPPLPGFTEEDIAIASPDGNTLDLFNSEGRQLETRHVLTGALRYRFTYDSTGRLTQITDVNNNTTTIQRDNNGTPTGITSPFGQATALTVNADGYLESATNPAGETVGLGYSSGGLLSQFTDALGGLYQFYYDGQGRVTQDHDPAGGTLSLARSEFRGGHNVGVEGAQRTLSHHQVQVRATGERRIEVAGADGSRTVIETGTNGTSQISRTGNLSTTRRDGPDPRFGLQVALPQDVTATLPSGLAMTVTTARSVTLGDPQDPLSLEQQTDTRAINGRVYATTYQAPTKKITTTTPSGRVLTTTIDDKGQTTGREVPGLEPLDITYDSRGRISTTTQGTRTSSLSYDANGYLASVTDPLSRSVTLTRDAVGRVVTQTLPGGRTTEYTYDDNGNMTSVVPPGRTAHVFTYTEVNQRETYVPPLVGSTAGTTVHQYNLDRQLTQITRPDGQSVGFVYDERGQLQTQTLPQSQTSHYTYEAGTGALSSVTATDGGTVSFSYDGLLKTHTSWTGPVTGSVGYTHDHNFRVTSQSVNGGQTINFAYDLDGVATQVGDLMLTRNGQNGLLTGTTLGDVSDTLSYNGFAEPTDYRATVENLPVFHQLYTRDALGRITEKTETVDGTTTTYAYTYDLAGRLIEVKQNGVVSVTYTYDQNGNRLTKVTPGGTTTYTTDAQDRLLSAGATTYTYNANGEVTSKTSGGQTTTYTVDVFGNIVAALLPDGRQIAYVRDGLQRRIGKKVNTSSTPWPNSMAVATWSPALSMPAKATCPIP